MKNLSVFFILFIFSYIGIQGQGYDISVTIKGYSDTNLILGHYFAKQNFVVKDTASLDKKGYAKITGEEPLPAGIYSFVLSSTRLFDFIVGDDQEFEIFTDTSDFVSNKVVKGNKDEEIFIEYQKFLKQKSKEAREINKAYLNTEDKKKKKKFEDKLREINQEVKQEQRAIIDKYQGSFIAQFIKATQEVEVPPAPRDEQGNITDPKFQYNYYKEHYFDNFDFTDHRLLRTPIYEEKFMTYFTKVIPQVPDSIINEIDKIVMDAKENKEVFRYILRNLFNHFVKNEMMGMENVWVHIAKEYYLTEENDWSDDKFLENLEKRVNEIEHTLIGKKATNSQLVFISKEHFIEAEEDTAVKNDVYAGGFFNIHDIKAEYTILHFWAADCGHCEESVPELYSMYQDSLKENGVAVIAVHIVGGKKGKRMWVDFVNENEIYEWINAWNPYSFDYKKDFDIQTSNVLYLLDKDKRIIGKRINPEQAAEIIWHEMKHP